jgi:citrate synthase
LQKGWNLADNAVPLLNAALILCADHELNISAFTARCVASAQSNLYQVVLAGLAALQGAKHGGQSARVWAMFNEVTDTNRAHMQLAQRLRRGDKLVGFGHPLYPDGDPRGLKLMEMVEAVLGETTAFQRAKTIATAAYDLIGEHPNIDFALLTLVTSLELPPETAITIFALGRTAGWIAHALEQYDTDKLIRPRARYIGN